MVEHGLKELTIEGQENGEMEFESEVGKVLVAGIITLHLTIKEERRLEQVSIMRTSEFVLVS